MSQTLLEISFLLMPSIKDTRSLGIVDKGLHYRDVGGTSLTVLALGGGGGGGGLARPLTFCFQI